MRLDLRTSERAYGAFGSSSDERSTDAYLVVCRTHPDRLQNATPDEKRAATEKFQVCDAMWCASSTVKR